MKKIYVSLLLILLVSQGAYMQDLFYRSSQASEIPGMNTPSQSGLYGIYVIMHRNGPGNMKAETLMALVRHPLIQEEILKSPDDPRAAHEAIFDLMDRAQKIWGY